MTFLLAATKARLWAPPAATAVTPVRLETSTGVVDGVADAAPLPS